MTTIYKIYYTEDGICKSIEEFKLSIALQVTENLRSNRRLGDNITHITMVSEDSNMVGEQGVSAIEDGLTPSGAIYDWKKDRAGRFKDADKTKKHLKPDEQ